MSRLVFGKILFSSLHPFDWYEHSLHHGRAHEPRLVPPFRLFPDLPSMRNRPRHRCSTSSPLTLLRAITVDVSAQMTQCCFPFSFRDLAANLSLNTIADLMPAADGTRSSLKSYASPDRDIRHCGFCATAMQTEPWSDLDSVRSLTKFLVCASLCPRKGFASSK